MTTSSTWVKGPTFRVTSSRLSPRLPVSLLWHREGNKQEKVSTKTCWDPDFGLSLSSFDSDLVDVYYIKQGFLNSLRLLYLFSIEVRKFILNLCRSRGPSTTPPTNLCMETDHNFLLLKSKVGQLINKVGSLSYYLLYPFTHKFTTSFFFFLFLSSGSSFFVSSTSPVNNSLRFERSLESNTKWWVLTQYTINPWGSTLAQTSSSVKMDPCHYGTWFSPKTIFCLCPHL